ncbi:phosphoenolpyruvate synthase [Dendrosporobacter sp. 1207_IL3150]|uniref:phosphoenolpyruvate synthase n=1 Tax=Dendrosporobacter sp. 1207_IL3150 TaxID=3084054 RepID=UPI002FDA8B41
MMHFNSRGRVIMQQYVLPFTAIDRSKIAVVGGKGANLGELFNVPGIFVPEGFCITTEAYKRFIASNEAFNEMLNSLERMTIDNIDAIETIGSKIRSHLEKLAIPQEIKAEVSEIWEHTGKHFFYAIRSSATAEDLPGASFAGQQDTYLNISGLDEILIHIRKCWASLFTDRAIIYRIQNGFNHRDVYLAVVVQRMIFPEVAGIMFTADPVSGNRKVVSIDASYGLGEALVSGIVSADLYRVRDGTVINKKIAEKKIAIYGLEDGGTIKRAVAKEKVNRQSIEDQVAVVLAELGQKIEQHFGCPQDIEWCIADDTVFILQSRPITTLYPVPRFFDERLHLLISLGHAQMMTNPIKPLGISILKTFMPLGKNGNQRTESNLMAEAGGRLYIDITKVLDYKLGRKLFPGLISNADEFIGNALREFSSWKTFKIQSGPGKKIELPLIAKIAPFIMKVFKNIVFKESKGITERVDDLIDKQIRVNRDIIYQKVGIDRVQQIQQLLPTMLPFVLKNVGPYIGTGLLTYRLINKLAGLWLNDTEQELRGISKAPVGNVTSEMGLALGDVADIIRGYPSVIEYLKTAADAEFMTGLDGVEGGNKVKTSLNSFLAQYGMRATGEIDITVPRWREDPTQLIGSILSNVESNSAGMHRTQFLQGEVEAKKAVESLIRRLQYTRFGFIKAKIMKHLLVAYRQVIGVREHPKFFIVQNFDIIKKAILEEAEYLVAAKILEKADDVFWLSLDELIEVINSKKADLSIIKKRQEEFKQYIKLSPPRAMTSEGEIITGLQQQQDIPEGALVGSPVSVGLVEGRARVITNLANARLNKGEILVAPFTDPGWTPLFPLAGGLVTEAGGLMTHGAVVAREYGIPAVVGVDGATVKIKDGEMIRIDGRKGYVKILSE